MMKIKVLLIFVILCLSGCASKGKAPVQSVTPSGAGTLFINAINFDKQAYIRDAVKKECQLPEKLLQFTQQYAANHYAKIITGPNSVPNDAQVLTIEIKQVQGGGGGAWSGGKMVLINGKLTEKGKVIGDFKGRRYSGGGMFGGYKGTCAILGRCVKALGRDIAEWLNNPKPQSVLGDL